MPKTFKFVVVGNRNGIKLRDVSSLAVRIAFLSVCLGVPAWVLACVSACARECILFLALCLSISSFSSNFGCLPELPAERQALCRPPPLSRSVLRTLRSFGEDRTDKKVKKKLLSIL
jgi:hypothetical protein